jgi:hypothetical protein
VSVETGASEASFQESTKEESRRWYDCTRRVNPVWISGFSYSWAVDGKAGVLESVRGLWRRIAYDLRLLVYAHGYKKGTSTFR